MIFQNITEHQAYDTHFNYIKCLCSLTKGTALQYTGSLRKASLPDIEEKKNLIDLTKKSLTDEHKIVGIDKDYSYASTSWLPVKSYYLIFNILLTIEYIFKIQKSTFRFGHNNCVDVEDWKQKNHINLKKTAHKTKYQNYLSNFSVSIFDFPYYMRIRSNYRDFAFIDGVTTDQTAEYFNTFFSFTVHFVKMLEKLKTGLIASRT